MDDKLLHSLYKKAVGYTVTEKTLEYSPEGDVVKKKVTSTNYPPDIAALKAYLELAEGASLECMSDDELARDKTRILKVLEEMENGIDETQRESPM